VNSDCVHNNCSMGKCKACPSSCLHASGDECNANAQCASGVCKSTGLFKRCM
jgi:hypothetical protein